MKILNLIVLGVAEERATTLWKIERLLQWGNRRFKKTPCKSKVRKKKQYASNVRNIKRIIICSYLLLRLVSSVLISYRMKITPINTF